MGENLEGLHDLEVSGMALIVSCCISNYYHWLIRIQAEAAEAQQSKSDSCLYCVILVYVNSNSLLSA